MPTRLDCVVLHANDAPRVAAFWGKALGWTVTEERGGWHLVAPYDTPAWADGGPPPLLVLQVPDRKDGKNRVHLDLVSASEQAQQATVERLLGLGATPTDIGQGEVAWAVLADPEGNELCVLDPRDRYAASPTVAAVVLDAADPAGLAAFWSEATGWPVVEAQPRYAALRHPDRCGTWLELVAVDAGKTRKHRVHLDLAPRAGDDHAVEVARLVQAGARHVDGQARAGWTVLADPEGNEVCVLPPR